MESLSGEEGLTPAPLVPEKRPRIFINVILFILTIITTFVIGAVDHIGFQSNEPIVFDLGFIHKIFDDPSILRHGFYFSIAIMGFLLSHELGHYFTCRRYNIKATLPYFIPAPTLVGTFGAFIKIKSPIKNKKALFDIGIAGPLAGFAAALPTLIVGLKLSKPIFIPPVHRGLYLGLGEPLLFNLIERAFLPIYPDNYDLLLHPIALAGWFGCLATALNLLPISQLDGGHISYAIFGKHYSKVSLGVFSVIILMGFITGFPGWFFWGLLILLLGLRHPRTLDDELPLDGKRKLLGLLALIIFILTFMAKPIYIS